MLDFQKDFLCGGFLCHIPLSWGADENGVENKK